MKGFQELTLKSNGLKIYTFSLRSTVVAVANGKSWGIFWRLVDYNSFWNNFSNIKSRNFIKCPPLDAREVRNNF